MKTFHSVRPYKRVWYCDNDIGARGQGHTRDGTLENSYCGPCTTRTTDARRVYDTVDSTVPIASHRRTKTLCRRCECHGNAFQISKHVRLCFQPFVSLCNQFSWYVVRTRTSTVSGFARFRRTDGVDYGQLNLENVKKKKKNEIKQFSTRKGPMRRGSAEPPFQRKRFDSELFSPFQNHVECTRLLFLQAVYQARRGRTVLQLVPHQNNSALMRLCILKNVYGICFFLLPFTQNLFRQRISFNKEARTFGLIAKNRPCFPALRSVTKCTCPGNGYVHNNRTIPFSSDKLI